MTITYALELETREAFNVIFMGGKMHFMSMMITTLSTYPTITRFSFNFGERNLFGSSKRETIK